MRDLDEIVAGRQAERLTHQPGSKSCTVLQRPIVGATGVEGVAVAAPPRHETGGRLDAIVADPLPTRGVDRRRLFGGQRAVEDRDLVDGAGKELVRCRTASRPDRRQ